MPVTADDFIVLNANEADMAALNLALSRKVAHGSSDY